MVLKKVNQRLKTIASENYKKIKKIREARKQLKNPDNLSAAVDRALQEKLEKASLDMENFLNTDPSSFLQKNLTIF
ncbi:MAG: hypothetical protein ABH821_03125 [archaeon]